MGETLAESSPPQMNFPNYAPDDFPEWKIRAEVFEMPQPQRWTFCELRRHRLSSEFRHTVVIPMARAFTGGPRDLAGTSVSLWRKPMLHLKKVRPALSQFHTLQTL
jgi:hypothetical protein